jgi:hypothetical protein
LEPDDAFPDEMKPVFTNEANHLLESLQDLRQGLWQLGEGKSVLLLKRPVVGHEVEAELIVQEVRCIILGSGLPLWRANNRCTTS